MHRCSLGLLLVVLCGSAPARAQPFGVPGRTAPTAPTKPTGTFCQPGLEIRCSCGLNHWETTRCRDDGTNWEFCPCPDEEEHQPRRIEHPSARSTPLIGAGVALTALGGAALGTSVALRAENVPACTAGSTTCVQGFVPLVGGGIVLTAVGIPLWITGAAPMRPDERPRDTAMMVGGSFASGFGVVALAGGVTALAVGDSIGWWPVLFGGVGLAGGIALTIYGGWEVPDEAAPRPPPVGLAPRLVVGPGSISVRGTF